MSAVTLDAIEPGLRLPPLGFHVTATRLIAGALASRDYSPLHHDRDYVVNVAGQRDIFANTQFQAALFERYLYDWSGPLGRIARMKFRMTSSIFAGDEALIEGVVQEVLPDSPCGPAVSVKIAMTVAGEVRTSCEILYALPSPASGNPWQRKGEAWIRP